MQTVTAPGDQTTGYDYYPEGSLQTVTSPNGSIAEYAYDANQRLTNLENRTGAGAVINSYAYSLDNVGNRTRVIENSGRIVDYDYDDLYRLTLETITEPGFDALSNRYEYDNTGNRTLKETCDDTDCETTSYAYNANNWLQTETGPAGTINYTYDDNGNTLEKSDGTNTTTYAYNSRNKMIQANTGSSIIEFGYDADGARTSKTVDGIAMSYLVDKNRRYAQVIEERNGTGDLLANYNYGQDLISQSRDGVESYYHYDGLGSTRALSDKGQVVTDTYDYEAYGELLSQTGSTSNNYLYTGEQFDSETELYYLRARHMDPKVGRFVGMDSWLGDDNRPLSLNKYAYADGNPVNGIDPSGHFTLMSVNATIAIRGVLSAIQTDIGAGVLQHALLDKEIGAPLLAQARITAADKAIVLAIGIGLTAVAAKSISSIVRYTKNVLIKPARNPSKYIYGPHGKLSRAALHKIANSGGPTANLVTRLTNTPAKGRGLSIAVGDGADTLANAAREDGVVFVADIPTRLIKELASAGFVEEKICEMNGRIGTELRFLPEASEFIIRFF